MLDVIPPHIGMKEPNDGDVEASKRSLQHPRCKKVAPQLDDVGLLGNDYLAQPSNVGEEVVAWTRRRRWAGDRVQPCRQTIDDGRLTVVRSWNYDYVLDIRIRRQPSRFVLEIRPYATAGERVELRDVEEFQRETTSSYPLMRGVNAASQVRCSAQARPLTARRDRNAGSSMSWEICAAKDAGSPGAQSNPFSP